MLPQACSVPDVWLQLLESCVADSSCHPSVLHSLEQRLQLADRRTLAEHMQQLTAGQQQQAPAEQGAQCDEDIAGLRKRLQQRVQELRAELQQHNLQ